MNNNNYMIKQGHERRLAILNAGLQLWPDVNPSTIAKNLGITHAAVLYHFPNVKDAVAFYAVENRHLPVLVQLIATDHEAVSQMTVSEKHECLREFAKSIKPQDDL